MRNPYAASAGLECSKLLKTTVGDTYRAVYTVRFKDWIYVLHCFQKKSRRGNETPKHDMNLIRERLRQAQGIEAAETSRR